jgi:hypothetical protein
LQNLLLAILIIFPYKIIKMKIFIVVILLLSKNILFAQTGNVGIGTAIPTDKLHINSPINEDPLRVQVNNTTKLRVWANGGTSIGALATPPANGLLVQGTLQPQNDIVTPNKMIIESTADSLIINAGGSQVIIAANGNIIIRSGATSKIDIDAGGQLNLSGNTITIQASTNLNLNAPLVKFNGGNARVARVGDAVIGGIISGGSSSVFAN